MLYADFHEQLGLFWFHGEGIGRILQEHKKGFLKSTRISFREHRTERDVAFRSEWGSAS